MIGIHTAGPAQGVRKAGIDEIDGYLRPLVNLGNIDRDGGNIEGSVLRGELDRIITSDVGGYDTIQLSTEYGALYISAVSVNIPEIDEGAEITVYFVYSGFSDALGGPCGVYAYHE